ncbi:MAG TPA: aspartate aminotransferase family protein [Cellvibrionaceae bacterium]
MTGMTLMNTYGNRTTTLTKGDGPYLWDSEGRRYLDGISGIAVCGLGYNYPAVTQAICEQSQKLLHTSNLYNIPSQQELGARLVAISGMDKAFFSNSGAEANEAAIKIARKFANDKGIMQPHIITTQNSFHGRTLATLSASGNTKIQKGFYPLVEGFTHVPFNDLAAIAAAATENTVAVMLEPVQGEGGIKIPSPDFLPKLRALCDEKGWLLILDEIQTGNGRTGKYFAYQHYGFLPDVVTTAKGLGNGVPIGACLARGAAAEVLQQGNHGTTFGGNPLACSAALAVVGALEEPALMARITTLGERIKGSLQEALAGLPKVKEVRGQGLLIGIELTEDCAQLVEAAKQKGFLINVTAGNTVRLLPPFILTDEQADALVQAVVTLIQGL